MRAGVSSFTPVRISTTHETMEQRGLGGRMLLVS